MTLEAIYQQDPFMYGYRDYGYNMGFAGYHENNLPEEDNGQPVNNAGNWDSPPTTHNSSSSSEGTCGGGDGFFGGAGGEVMYEAPGAEAAGGARRKRRRAKAVKNKEEMENQRMTHIAVERNRRRQMNDYLAVLRSLMPPSYAQRGDQASIVGGAINFTKELEQLLQFLEAHKLTGQHPRMVNAASSMFSNFFTFPQYSMSQPSAAASAAEGAVEKRSGVADIEVSMVESHANVKILSRRRPKQLLKMVAGFQSLSLTILHLNITTVDQCMLYSFSVKVEDECQLTTVNEIATAVHEMMEMIQREYQSNGGHAAT
ncbi:Transcription factor bHLH96 [Striga hermonthica]|uniref:Transcription factor bHLH96 n=1 Tax=Striga hermonthica TaxID=68872 RepID=A0A9N7N206_STRHE|nr:Transcription factor bHLH96 [Striga hermonthica]